MQRFYSEQDYRNLEQELQKTEYHKIFQDLQQTDQHFKQFTSLLDVIRFVQNESSADLLVDLVLRSFINAVQKYRDEQWNAILLVSFWPSRSAIFYRNRSWDNDADNLWGNITETFLQVIRNINLTKRSSYLRKKIINDTQCIVYKGCRKEWRQNKLVVSSDDYSEKWLEKHSKPQLDPHFDEIDRNDVKAFLSDQIHQCLASGCINDAEYHRLKGEMINGQTNADYAREHGISRERARQLKCRAIKAIKILTKS